MKQITTMGLAAFAAGSVWAAEPDVKKDAGICLETLGRDGGSIYCSCHNMQPGTSVDNILAMIETV